MRRHWGSWSCSAWRRAGLGGSHQRCVQRGWKQVLPPGAQWQDPRKQAQTETQESLPQHQDKHIQWGWLSTGTGCPHRWWSLHPLRCSKAPERGAGQPALGGPAWAGGGTRWPPEVPANLNHSVSQQHNLKTKQTILCCNRFCIRVASSSQTTHFSKLRTGF